MEKLKTIVLATSILLLTPSCSIYRNSGVLGFPEKEDFEEKIERYTAGVETKNNQSTKEKEVKFEYEFMRF